MKMEIDLPVRKRTRLEHYDYSSGGAYFITVCTQNRRKILSSIIVGEGFPLPQLTKYGDVVDRWIRNIPDKYSGISVDSYVIMPNHIHLLIGVIMDGGRGDPSPTIHSIMGWLKYQTTKEINKMQGTVGEKVFQRSFYDHIIRDRENYEEHLRYIHENPLRWRCDALYAEE